MTPSVHPKPPRGLRASWRQRISAGAAALVIALALAALAGWWLRIPLLTSLVAGWPTMKGNTALALLSAGLALLLAGRERHQPRGPARRSWRVAGLLLATWPVMIGGLTLAEYGSGRNFGLDQLLVADFLSAPHQLPGRPAPATALGLLLAGVALSAWRYPQALVFFSTCTGAVMGLAWLAITGLLYGVQEKATTVFFGTTSLPTSLGFFALSIGLFLLRPKEGLARLFTSPHHAGRLARRLVPLAVGLTVGLGGLRLWAQNCWQFPRSWAWRSTARGCSFRWCSWRCAGRGWWTGSICAAAVRRRTRRANWPPARRRWSSSGKASGVINRCSRTCSRVIATARCCGRAGGCGISSISR